VKNIAADRDQQAIDVALVAADRERIKQGLRGMLMRAVTGIDHRAVDLACQQFDRAGRMMAHDNNVGMHGIERYCRIDQCLALAHRGRTGRHVHNIGAKALARQFKRGLGAGRHFEEKIDLGTAAQRRAFLFNLTVELDEFFGEVEKTGNILVRKPFYPQQVPSAEDKRGFRRNGH
jgi:hypothetical protein